MLSLHLSKTGNRIKKLNGASKIKTYDICSKIFEWKTSIFCNFLLFRKAHPLFLSVQVGNVAEGI